MSDLQELKKEADDLGVAYNKNVSANVLQAKIEAFYEAKETPDPVIEAALANDVSEAAEEDEAKAEESSTKTPAEIAVEVRKGREVAARKTRIVTIIDNDQRVNTHTTTCTVNCSNEFFDLGTRILPLNEKIEVAVGHLRTLERVKIPQHVRDNKTGLSTVRLRPRYTISYS